MSLCFISNLPSLILTRLHRVTVIPPSPAALASGSDQDYQLDIISELDLANATYGITQVAGLHNNSKAFLFRGNARTHARTHWRFLPQKFWTVFVSRVHTRVSTRLFVLLVSVIKGAHATPLWRDRGRTPGGASSHNYSTFHSSFIRRCSDSSGLTGAPRDVHQQSFTPQMLPRQPQLLRYLDICVRQRSNLRLRWNDVVEGHFHMWQLLS